MLVLIRELAHQGLLVLVNENCRQPLALHEAPLISIKQVFRHDTWHPVSQSPQNTNRRHHFSLLLGTEKHSPSHYSMPRKHKIVEAASLFRKNTMARVIEWEPKVYSQGIRDVPVEVSTAASQSRPRKKARRRRRAENNDKLQGETPGETPPHPMDVDETFWVDEPVMPSSEKKVRQLICLSLANLTNLPVPALIHRRIYPKDWPLLTLPPRF